MLASSRRKRPEKSETYHWIEQIGSWRPEANPVFIRKGSKLNDMKCILSYYHRYFIDQYVVSYQILGYFNKISVRPLKERKLGSGSFGSVYLCTHMMDEIELGVFAVKKLALGDDARRLRQVVREVKALELLGPGFRVHVLFFCCFSMFFLCFFWGVGVGVWMNDRLTRCTEMILEYL